VAATNAPVGILGGTFDPVHFGHLRLAQELGEVLQLSEVRFVPSGTPPHRVAPWAAAAQRAAMVRLAIAGNPLFTLDEREVARGGPGYMIETLTELRRELGATRPLCLLLGADAFLDLATWHRWHELFNLAHVVAAHRPGFPIQTWSQRMPQPLAREYEARHMEQPLAVHLSPAGGIVAQPIAALDIAAIRIRATLHEGRSPRYLLPAPVLDYIRDNSLYAGGE
jgi:nicotinate-nucleotide adenylyltransferase